MTTIAGPAPAAPRARVAPARHRLDEAGRHSWRVAGTNYKPTSHRIVRGAVQLHASRLVEVATLREDDRRPWWMRTFLWICDYIIGPERARELERT